MQTRWAGVLMLALSAGAYAQSSHFDFESDLQGWSSFAIDWNNPPTVAPWTIERSGERSYDGQWSIKLDADNYTDAIKLWIERPFIVIPNLTYKVDVKYRFATNVGEIGSWSILNYVRDNPARQFDEFFTLGSTFNEHSGDPNYYWLEKSFSRNITPTDNNLWIGLGVWGTFEVRQIYFIDSVDVTVTPVPEPMTVISLTLGAGGLLLKRKR